MKINLGKNSKTRKDWIFTGCICILFYVAITHIGLIFSYIGKFIALFKPIILGGVMAYIITPLAKLLNDRVFRFIKKERLKWIVSVVVSVLIAAALILGFLVVTVPELIGSVVSLLENMNTYLNNLEDTINEIDPAYRGILYSLYEKLMGDSAALDHITELFTKNLTKIMQYISSIGSGAMTTGIAAIIAFYILLSKDSLRSFFKKFMTLILSPLHYYQTGTFLQKFNSIFTQYIVCEILDACIVGVSNYIFMLIAGMPDTVLISIIVGVTNLFPTFGPIVGCIAGGIVLLLVDPSCVIAFLIFTIILQTIDGYVIKPKFFGQMLNVPGILILFSIIVFGNLWGVIGVLVSIPLAAILSYLYTEVFVPWLEMKKDMKAYSKASLKAEKTDAGPSAE